jgi:hypothetical protein
MFSLQIFLGRQEREDENTPNVYFDKRPTGYNSHEKRKTNKRKEGELGACPTSLDREIEDTTNNNSSNNSCCNNNSKSLIF